MKQFRIIDKGKGVLQLTSSNLHEVDDETKSKTSELVNDGSDGKSAYVEFNELGDVATSNDYNDLNNLPESEIPSLQEVVDSGNIIVDQSFDWIFNTITSDGVRIIDTFNGNDTILGSLGLITRSRSSPLDFFNKVQTSGILSKHGDNSGVVTLTSKGRTNNNTLELKYPNSDGIQTIATLQDISLGINSRIKNNLPVDFFISTTKDKHLTYLIDGVYKEFDLLRFRSDIVNSNEIFRSETNTNDLFIIGNFVDNNTDAYIITLKDCYIQNNVLQISDFDTRILPISKVHATVFHRDFLYIFNRADTDLVNDIIKINPNDLTDIKKITLPTEYDNFGFSDVIAYKNKLFVLSVKNTGAAIIEIDTDLNNFKKLFDVGNITNKRVAIHTVFEIYNDKFYIPTRGLNLNEGGILVCNMVGDVIQELHNIQFTSTISARLIPHWITIFNGKIIISYYRTKLLARFDLKTLALEELYEGENSVTDDNTVFKNGYIYINEEKSSDEDLTINPARLLKIKYNDFTDLTVEIANYNNGLGSYGSINPKIYKESLKTKLSEFDNDSQYLKIEDLGSAASSNVTDFATSAQGLLAENAIPNSQLDLLKGRANSSFVVGDFNTATQRGWQSSVYRGASLNSPSGVANSNIWYVHFNSQNTINLSGVQTLYPYRAFDNMYQRTVHENTWGSWKKIPYSDEVATAPQGARADEAHSWGNFKDFGLGGYKVSNVLDIDEYIFSGFYLTPNGGLLNLPIGFQNSRCTIIVNGSTTYHNQLLWDRQGNFASRFGQAAVYTDWVIHKDASNFATAAQGALADSSVQPNTFKSFQHDNGERRQIIKLTSSSQILPNSYTHILTGSNPKTLTVTDNDWVHGDVLLFKNKGIGLAELAGISYLDNNNTVNQAIPVNQTIKIQKLKTSSTTFEWHKIN